MVSFSGYEDLKKVSETEERVIYSARREKDQTPVRISTLRSDHPSLDSIALLYHEYEISKDIRSPCILKTYSLIDEQNQYGLVQEAMVGVSLQDYLRQYPIQDLSLFFKLAIPMADIIGKLQQNHIIHKDIKPSSFIVQPDTFLEKITDFNYASKLLHEVQDIAPPEKLEGTLAYMAPEQTGRMNMKVDYRSDFYALGVTFFEMLSGHLPFSSQDPLELLHAHLANKFPELTNPNLDIPPALVAIVRKLMAKNPSDRYQSAVGLEEDLKRCEKELSENGKISDFVLGEKDVFDRLNLSQKLYGRQKEAEILLEHYEKAAQGSSEVLMVCGYSGIGKTMLVDEVHKPMVKQNGYFINGKFDLLQRTTPYTAITQALDRLARLILAEDEFHFAKIAESIKDALGQYGQILLELAPNFKQIIGPQPPLQKLTPSESQNQMRNYFIKFIKVMATQDHPLVIFIDDLQWADIPSLKLLEYILLEESLPYLMVIGAYRDNEVDESHPLRGILKKVEEERGSLTFLELKPLTLTDFSELFEDSFLRKREDILPLVDLVYTKTQGNPFFCKQIISLLYRDNILFFDYEKREWCWDLEKVRELNLSDNVVDLMVAKLSSLPEATQSLLKYAGCIGREFTIEMLKLVTGKPAPEVAQLLWPSLQEELLITLSLGHKRVDALRHENLDVLLSKAITYRFVHDRVQQAVYQGVSELQSQQIHLDVARILLEKKPEACKAEGLFEVTDHFNKAKNLLNPNEKIEVINLNLRAGLRAFESSAYLSMRSYIESALSLCEPNAFSENHELMMNLNLAYVKSLYLTGSSEQALALVSDLMSKSRNSKERAVLCRLEGSIHYFRSNVQLTLKSYLKAFNFLGVKIPENPSKLLLLKKHLQIKFALRSYDLSNLDKALPPLTDLNIQTFFEIFNESSILFGSAPLGLRVCVWMESMRLMLKYGSPLEADFVLVVYGTIIMNTSRNLSTIGTLLELSKRYRIQKNHPSSAITSLILEAFTAAHFFYPFKRIIGLTDEALEAGFSSGALIPLASVFIIRTLVFLVKEKSINEVREAILVQIKYVKKWKLNNQLIFGELLLTVVDAQMDLVSEDSILSAYEKAKSNLSGSSKILAEQIMGRFYFFQEKYTEVCGQHFRWYKETQVHYYTLGFSQMTLDAIALIKCFPTLPSKDKKHYQRQFQKLYKDLKWAGEANPEIYEGQYWILEGVKNQVKGDYPKALVAFEKAIEINQRRNYYLWVAVANECVADLYVSQNQARAASDYVREAYYYYELYGMITKLNLLQNRYPQFFIERVESNANFLRKDSPTLLAGTTIRKNAAALDFLSVIKASQMISAEIVPVKLFEKILHILLENAGAEKVIFLEKNNDTWVVTARQEREKGEEKFEMMGVPLHEFENLPHGIIQYSSRSEEPVVLTNASEDSHYRRDPYILRVQPKSVLCLPVLHQDKVACIIYFENNLTIGAFTQERVTVLTTLGSQIAISLKNSRYVSHVENLYRSTERFVPKQFLEMLHRKTIEEIKLGDCLRLNISVLFADIRKFTTILESLDPEAAFAFVNRYWAVTAPVIRKNRGFINQYQGDGILALFPEESDDAVAAGMEMLQVLSEFNKEQVKLNAPPLEIGIGINSGSAMIGIIGEKERLEPAIVSDIANTASRVETLNKTYGTHFLLSGNSFNMLKNHTQYQSRIIDRVRLKGKNVPTYLHEIIDWEQQLQNITLANYVSLFSDAFLHYEKMDFVLAKQKFSDCLKYRPNDVVAEILKQRCEEFVLQGTPEGWDGVYTLTHK